MGIDEYSSEHSILAEPVDKPNLQTNQKKIMTIHKGEKIPAFLDDELRSYYCRL